MTTDSGSCGKHWVHIEIWLQDNEAQRTGGWFSSSTRAVPVETRARGGATAPRGSTTETVATCDR
jgi:hypothetical protein